MDSPVVESKELITTVFWHSIKETFHNVRNFVQNLEYFDIQTVDDLYKFFFMCHLFSWLVLLYKIR